MAAGRSQEPPESSLLRWVNPLAGICVRPFVGDPVRDRLTLPQSLEVLLGFRSSAVSVLKGRVAAQHGGVRAWVCMRGAFCMMRQHGEGQRKLLRS